MITNYPDGNVEELHVALRTMRLCDDALEALEKLDPERQRFGSDVFAMLRNLREDARYNMRQCIRAEASYEDEKRQRMRRDPRMSGCDAAAETSR